MESFAIDKISSLPDDILFHVLSFMSVKRAVQTCILSKRWRNVWASMPILKFNVYDFGLCDGWDERFKHFVNAMMINRGQSPLHTFEYFYLSSDIYHFSLKLLNRVLALKPQVISINFNIRKEMLVPYSLFSCASVQKLNLHFTSILYKTISVRTINLPSLKVLKIQGADINNDFTQKLFSGCPALESLSLDCCVLNIFDITSKILKVLHIHFWKLNMIQISCPALLSLSIHFCNVKGEISLDSMPLLENAVIRSDEQFFSLPILNVLRCISNASTMTLLGGCQLKKQLEKDILNCGTFDNLKKLVIGDWDMINDFNLLASFLKNSPNLQELALHLIHEELFYRRPVRDVLFQHEHLGTVKIYHGNKDKRVSELVKILLRHVKTIGNIIVV